MKTHSIHAMGTVVMLAFAIQGFAQSTYEPYTFTTLAGGGGFNSPDEPGTAARFFIENGVAVDSAGNIYLADKFNNIIRKVMPNGVVTTLAGQAGTFGSTDGIGSEARFTYPQGLALDVVGNVYVADNSTIRKVTPEGVVTTLAGKAGVSGSANGTNGAARFGDVYGLAVDNAGDIFVPDAGNHSIRKLTSTGTNWAVTTIAGASGSPGSVDGTNRVARFNFPQGLAIDSAGNLYVADTGNYTVRKMMPVGTNWVVTTIAGKASSFGGVDGTNGAARFGELGGMAVDSAGNLFVPDTSNNSIRKLTPTGTNWAVTTIAGLAGNPGSVDGTGNVARFNFPYGIATDSTGSVYVSDAGNGAIRKLVWVGTNWVATTVAGLGGIYGSADGIGRDATFRGPSSVAVDSEGSVYVADGLNHTIRK